MAKNRATIISVLFVLWGVLISFQTASVEQVYTSQIGVTEKPRGSNSGNEVNKYLRSVHINYPAPWCAAFVHWCLDSAGIYNTITAYSPTAQNNNNLVYYNHRLLKTLLPGDVFTIYFPSLKRIAHTGFANHQINNSIIETVEGNSNDGGSREGYGVFKRKRSLHTLYSISRWKSN